MLGLVLLLLMPPLPLPPVVKLKSLLEEDIMWSRDRPPQLAVRDEPAAADAAANHRPAWARLRAAETGPRLQEPRRCRRPASHSQNCEVSSRFFSFFLLALVVSHLVLKWFAL